MEENPEIKEIDQLKNFINDFAEWCECIVAREIIPLVCRRAIRRMNHWKEPIEINGSQIYWSGIDSLLDGDYPSNFNFFDILSIQIQNYYYDEINPYLREAIEGVLEYELSKLSNAERLVMEYSIIGDCELYECDHEQVINALFNEFHDQLNDHWKYTKKIQNYEDYNWW